MVTKGWIYLVYHLIVHLCQTRNILNGVASVPFKNQFTKLMNTPVQIASPILMIIIHQATVHK